MKMKQIINGKMYNTETAEFIGGYENDYYRNDFNWCYQELYRTKKGAFFIAGEGNANTIFSRRCGDNSWCGGEGIIPISEDEAREFAEKHLSIDTYVKTFGEPDEA